MTLTAPTRRELLADTRSLTHFSGSAYSFCVQDAKPLTRMYCYYYWCACTFASPQGEAAGRNLFACHRVI